MVIFAAVGGKMSLLGAVYGTLLVNTGKSLFSENFPQLWLFAMGGLFIAVVMFFPNGLAGLWESGVWQRLRQRRKLSMPHRSPRPAESARSTWPEKSHE